MKVSWWLETKTTSITLFHLRKTLQLGTIKCCFLSNFCGTVCLKTGSSWKSLNWHSRYPKLEMSLLGIFVSHVFWCHIFAHVFIYLHHFGVLRKHSKAIFDETSTVLFWKLALILSCVTSQNRQPHFKNLANIVIFVKCVWAFWDVAC